MQPCARLPRTSNWTGPSACQKAQAIRMTRGTAGRRLLHLVDRDRHGNGVAHAAGSARNRKGGLVVGCVVERVASACHGERHSRHEQSQNSDQHKAFSCRLFLVAGHENRPEQTQSREQ